MNVCVSVCVYFAWCALQMCFVVNILVVGKVNIIDLEVSRKEMQHVAMHENPFDLKKMGVC